MQTRRKTICGETMAAPKNILFHEFVQKGDWEFNAMLLKIAMKLDQEDVRRLKFLLSGPNGVSTREMERLTTAEEFFMCLKQRMMLTRDNLLVLQAFLTHLQRKDLREITEDYGRKIGNTLFFYEPPHQPENGFIHVRFRVVGNLDRFQRLDLDALRAYVARLLDVPQEFIFLVGVQQGSVILTFMIFEQFTEQLRDMFEKHKDSFSPFGVDGIFVVDPPTVDEREENIRDSSTQTYMEVAPVGDIQSQLSVMYDRQNQMTSQLGELKETTDDRLNQVTSQLVALEMTTDDRLSQMTSQISGLKETTVTSQLDDLAKNIYDRLNQVTSHLLVLKQATEQHQTLLHRLETSIIRSKDEQQRLCHVLQTSFIRSEEDQRRVLLALESPVLSPEEWKRNRSRPKDSTYSTERKPRRLSDNTYLSFRSEGKRESQQKVAKDHTGFQEDYPSTAETK